MILLNDESSSTHQRVTVSQQFLKDNCNAFISNEARDRPKMRNPNKARIHGEYLTVHVIKMLKTWKQLRTEKYKISGQVKMLSHQTSPEILPGRLWFFVSLHFFAQRNKAIANKSEKCKFRCKNLSLMFTIYLPVG